MQTHIILTVSRNICNDALSLCGNDSIQSQQFSSWTKYLLNIVVKLSKLPIVHRITNIEFKCVFVYK